MPPQGGEIKAFVNAGGNGLGLGHNDNTVMLSLGSGLLKQQPLQITEDSGLTERYLAQGIPTIHLLNVRALCEESGIPFDPETAPAIGTAAMYFGSGLPVPAAVAWSSWPWAGRRPSCSMDGAVIRCSSAGSCSTAWRPPCWRRQCWG